MSKFAGLICNTFKLLSFLNRHFQLLVLLFIWLIAGIYTGVASYAVIGASILLLKYKNRYFDLFIGFFFILILSDSRQYSLQFAAQFKNLYIVLLALFLLLDTKSFSFKNVFLKLFIPFFIVAVICLGFSGANLATGAQKTLSYILLMLLVPVYFTRIYDQYGKEVLKDIIWFGTLLIIIGLVLKVVMPDVVHIEGRFSGILGNPNGLGIFLLLFFILFSVLLHYYPELFTKTDKLLIYGVVFVSIILCQSRSALMAVLIFLAFKYFYRISPFLGFILFIVILFSYQVISSNIEIIIFTLGLQEYFRIDTFETGSGRLIAWKFAWDHIEKHFFLGKGFSYTDNLYRVNYDYLSRLGHQGNAHNSYLTFWLDTGLIGLLLYLRGLLLTFIKAARNTIVAIPVMYAILFSAFFESWLTASLNPFTIQLFMVLTIIFGEQFNTQMVSEKQNETEESANEDPVPVH